MKISLYRFAIGNVLISKSQRDGFSVARRKNYPVLEIMHESTTTEVYVAF